MERLRVETWLPRRGLPERGSIRQIEIDQLAAIVADRVIVTLGFAIVATGAVAKVDFVDQPGLFQVAQRVVDGCVADTGQSPAGSLEDIAGSGVIVPFPDHLKHCFPLRCQFWFLLAVTQDGFRLILSS